MKVRILRQWQTLPVGYVGNMGDGVATELIRRGMAEKVIDSPAPRNRAMSSPERRAERVAHVSGKARRITNGA